MHHSKLLKNLKYKDVCSLYINLILIMYSLNNATVKWNNAKTNKFSLKNGLKQGGIFSFLLFAIYLNPLLQKLQKVK